MLRRGALRGVLFLALLGLVIAGCNSVQPPNPTAPVPPVQETEASTPMTVSLPATLENDNPNRRTEHALEPTPTPRPPLPAGEGKIVFQCRGEVEYTTALCVLDSTGIRWLTSADSHRVIYGYSARLSPDGQVIAFVLEEEGSAGNIYLISIDGSGMRQLTDRPGGAKEPAWSPDGTRIAFIGWSRAETPGNEPLSHIFIVRTDGSDLRDVTGTRGGSQPDWSPDGQRIAFAGGKGIAVIHVDGSGWTDVIQFGYRDYFDRYFMMPRWSPDGRELALASQRIDYQDHQMYLFSLETGSMTRLTNLEDDPMLCPTWSPDGKKIAFSSGGFIRRLDLESGDVTTLARGDCPTWGP